MRLNGLFSGSFFLFDWIILIFKVEFNVSINCEVGQGNREFIFCRGGRTVVVAMVRAATMVGQVAEAPLIRAWPMISKGGSRNIARQYDAPDSPFIVAQSPVASEAGLTAMPRYRHNLPALQTSIGKAMDRSATQGMICIWREAHLR